MNFKDITNHEAACKVLEKDPAQSITTDQKITDVCNAINKLSGFKPDFNNTHQKKWRPYFWMDSSGFRFAARATVVRARVRVSARAFAIMLALKRKPTTLALSF